MKRGALGPYAREIFTRAFGGVPEVIWPAPGRVNIIGEHTDYQDGLCLPMAIDLQAVVAGRRRDDGVLRAYSATLNRWAEARMPLVPGASGDWFNYVAGVFTELAVPGGADLVLGGDVPLGAGVSSSAALELAVGGAANALYGMGRRPQELAEAGRRAEHRFAGVETGIMDQLASALGQEGHALLLDTRTRTATPVPFRPGSAGLALALVDTRVTRELVAGGYGARVREARAAAATLGVASLRDATPSDLARLEDPVLMRRARHIITENQRVLEVMDAAARDAWAVVGEALYGSHRSLAEDYEVSCPALDVVVAAARATPGVWGARMTGAGFGGSAIVLLNADAVERFQERLSADWRVHGWAPFAFRLVGPAAGAGLVVDREETA